MLVCTHCGSGHARPLVLWGDIPNPLCECPGAATSKCHKWGGLKQWECFLTVLEPKVQRQGVGSITISLDALGG